MITQCFEHSIEKICIPSDKYKPKKIAIFLPEVFRGGMLRRAKNIAKMIHLGSLYHEEPLEVVFSCCQGSYSLGETFSDLLKLGISIRETCWKKISKKEVQIIGNFRPIQKELLFEEYLLPTDGMNNFFDCDFWLLISDHTALPLAPIFPYGVFVYEYMQRYVPELFTDRYEKGYFSTARNANFVLATNPQTLNDAIQYAGINAKKIFLAPMAFDLPIKPSSLTSLHDKKYILWVTNAALRKNHMRALRAFELFYREHEGKFDVIILGTGTELFKDFSSANPSSYAREIAHKIEMSSVLKKKCHILGEVTETEYSNYLSQAQFLWVPDLTHAGSISAIESAYLKIPCLSSDNPSMRFIDNRFNLNLLFCDPYDVDEMAKKLKLMEKEVAARKDLLPNPNCLEKYTVEKLAPEFWTFINNQLSLCKL